MICMSCLSMYGKLLERFVWPSVIIIVINVIVSYVHKTQIYVSKYKVFQRPIYTTARKKTLPNSFAEHLMIRKFIQRN